MSPDRPRGMASLTESLTILLNPELRNTLDQRAAREERSVGQIARRALAAYLSVDADEETPADSLTPELPLL